MEIGPPTDTATCHLGIDVAERSDEALIESIAKGDKHALKILFARHNVQVYRFALRLTGNSSTAEDIVNLDENSVAEVSGIVDAPEKPVMTRMYCARKPLGKLLAVNGIHAACQ